MVIKINILWKKFKNKLAVVSKYFNVTLLNNNMELNECNQFKVNIVLLL